LNSVKCLAALAIITSFAASAHAETVTVSQKGRQFSTDSISVKKGDQVVFANDDTVPHNAVSKTAGNEFDLGYQQPGVSTPVTFDSAGDVAVICTIHPKMKLTVHVTQ
jgi:plastocyanin